MRSVASGDQSCTHLNESGDTACDRHAPPAGLASDMFDARTDTTGQVVTNGPTNNPHAINLAFARKECRRRHRRA
jgi:hypothetical protein